MTPQGWHAVDIGSEDSGEVRVLFEQVFGQPMGDALWDWKYAASRGVATGTRDRDGRLLAHYGGTARTLFAGDARIGAAQLGDVMVARDARGILSRRGPFATATKAFLERHVGHEQGFALGFGFPNARHARLGAALGLYQTLGEVKELRWDCTPRRVPWNLFDQCTPIDWSAPDTDGRLDTLWKELRASAQGFVLPSRDAPWWRHRFANHPEAAYRCWWVRSGLARGIVGAIALRPGASAGADWELLDWLGPLRQLSVLLSSARALCARHGSSRLHGWFSDSLAMHLRAAQKAPPAAEQTACFFCVTQKRSPGTAQDVLDRPWWLTGGDTDFR